MMYTAPRKEVLEKLGTSRHHGLTKIEADNRLAKNGPNQMQQTEQTPAWKSFIHSLREPIVIILWVAIALTIISAIYDFTVANDPAHGRAAIYEGIVIFIVIIINSTLTYMQSAKAQKSLQALQNMANHQVSVLRDDTWQRIDTTKLVVGDIVDFKMGDFIEGDVRWLTVNQLQVDESHLTGESDAIEKTIDHLTGEHQLGDRTNMGYSGSTIVNGSGIGVITATGMDTELGKIAHLLQQNPTQKTPIEKSIAELTKKLMIFAIFVVFIAIAYDIAKEILNTGTVTISGLMENISGAIALSVASIPDALPVVLSIVLTIGAKMLSDNKGLIKSLNSVETLGATTFIASDKTGTLTKNEMTVVNFFANGQDYEVDGNGYDPVGEIVAIDSPQNDIGYQDFINSAVLNNEASIQAKKDGTYSPFGNPTDVSLVVLGHKAHVSRDQLLNDEATDYDIIRVFPFDSTRKMMSTVVKCGDQYMLFTKGAPDVILEQAENASLSDKLVPINEAKSVIQTKIHEYANQALRTIAVAQRTLTEAQALHGEQSDLEQQFSMLGIAGIIDPPRPEVQESIELLHNANIETVMITGDHAETAKAIALKLGIIDSQNSQVVQGSELDQLSDEELQRLVPEVRVYARVSPEHKQRIVHALQFHDEVVAMTGDGVNDAPALRAADIGIAMGINGTEVTKDSADLILLDDKFTTIERSVSAGRTIFTNIKNFIVQELTTNVAEVSSLLLGTFLITQPIGQVSELTPTLTTLMVLWVNMISDSMPSFAMGYDKPQNNVMDQPPRDLQEPILNGTTLSRVLIRGLVMGLTVFFAFIWAAGAGMSAAESQTVAFLILVFGQLWHAFDARSATTLFRRNPFSNPYLLATVLFAGISSLAVTMLPFFNTLLGTATLNWQLYLAVIFIPAIPTFILSGIKELFRVRIW